MTLDDFMKSDSMSTSTAPVPNAPPKSAASSGSVSLSDFSGGDTASVSAVTDPTQIAQPQQKMEDIKPVDIPTGLFTQSGIFNGGLAAPVLDALTSSEQAAGHTISAAIQENLPEVQQAQSKAEQAKVQSMNVYNQLLAKRHQMFQAGKDTTQLDEAIHSAASTLGITGLENILPSAATKSAGQVLGEFGGIAMDLITSGTLMKGAKSFELLSAAEKLQLAEKGIKTATEADKALTTAQKYWKIAKTTAKTTAIGAGLGYGYDVTQNAQQGKTGVEAFKPGMGTVIGASILALFGLAEAGKLTAKQLAPAIDNWTMRALPKQFRYGANPGKTVAEMGITGNSLEDWGNNVTAARQKVGKTVGQLADKVSEESGVKTVDLTDQLKPIDEAIQKSAKNNDTAVMDRLQKAKQALQQEMRAGHNILDEKTGEKIFTEGATDKEGNMIVGSIGSRDLSKATFETALDIKRQVGDMTKWTGNAGDDKVVNLALKRTYGGISDKLESLASGTSIGDKFAKANQQYNDLSTAKIAIDRAKNLASSKQILGFGEKIAGTTAIITALAAAGPAAIPGILAGVAGDAMLHILNSVAVKTRVASWLGSESPSVIEKFYSQHPQIREAIYNTFIKDRSINPEARQKIVETASQEAGKISAKAAITAGVATTAGLTIKPLIDKFYENYKEGNYYNGIKQMIEKASTTDDIGAIASKLSLLTDQEQKAEIAGLLADKLKEIHGVIEKPTSK